MGSWRRKAMEIFERFSIKIQKNLFLVFLAFLLLLGPIGNMTNGWSSEVVDNSIYAELLKKHLKDGFVDYQGFKHEEPKLDRYLGILEKVNIKKLSRDEQFAFYVNAYNASTIKLILSGYPELKSIKDLGSVFKSPWKKKIVRIDGDVITLDDVEHNILRPRFKDPRVHFAINCSARSCPPIRFEPYRGSDLDKQLDEQTILFINDFNDDVIDFFMNYARGDLKKGLEAGRGKIKVKYLYYDWSLNDTKVGEK
jgi:hypothetical protein